MFPNKLKRVLKKNKFIYRVLLWLYTTKINLSERTKHFLLFNFFKVFPVYSKKIVFSNYYGNGYGDNPKSIADEIIKLGLKYDMVWLLKKELLDDPNLPSQIRAVKYGSIKAIYELVTASIWIDNCRKSSLIRKRKRQFYIQTWHGGIPMKQIEKDAENNLSSGYIENAKNDSRMANLFISNGKFCTNLYRSSFWYDGEILECGSPRCDILMNKIDKDKIEEKVRKFFDIKMSKRIVIYAPTFRTDSNTKVYDIDFDGLIKVLEKKSGGEWIILVRLHPNIASKDNFIEYSSTIINATDYYDMYELLACSDILITDYSSTMFEFSLTSKPVFLYATDIENYIKERNFYFDIHSLPYPLAENNQQLFNLFADYNESKYLIEVGRFLSDLGVIEHGNASTKVIEVINKISDSKNII